MRHVDAGAEPLGLRRLLGEEGEEPLDHLDGRPGPLRLRRQQFGPELHERHRQRAARLAAQLLLQLPQHVDQAQRRGHAVGLEPRARLRRRVGVELPAGDEAMRVDPARLVDQERARRVLLPAPPLLDDVQRLVARREVPEAIDQPGLARPGEGFVEAPPHAPLRLGRQAGEHLHLVVQLRRGEHDQVAPAARRAALAAIQALADGPGLAEVDAHQPVVDRVGERHDLRQAHPAVRHVRDEGERRVSHGQLDLAADPAPRRAGARRFVLPEQSDVSGHAWHRGPCRYRLGPWHSPRAAPTQARRPGGRTGGGLAAAQARAGAGPGIRTRRAVSSRQRCPRHAGREDRPCGIDVSSEGPPGVRRRRR